MKKIVYLLLFCFLFSFGRKEPNFSKEMIEKLDLMQKDKNYGLLPSKYIGLDLYFPTKDGTILQANNHELLFSFKKYYSKKFESFNEFLNVVLNEDFFLKDNNLKSFDSFWSFKLNSNIEKEYSNLGFDEFLKKYSKSSLGEEELKLNKSIIKPYEYHTIKYILYLNKYHIISDSHLGVNYIMKREDFFKK